MVFSSLIRYPLLYILTVLSFVFVINSLETRNHQYDNHTFRSEKQLHILKKMIAIRLQEINKPAVKTIQSPDGDIVDCVLMHKQLAFDHPLLKGEKLKDPPNSLSRKNQIENTSDHFQLWSLSGESCPEGTIPIRRISEDDMLRAHSINSFGRKYTDPSLNHEYAIIAEENVKLYGVEAIINVWNPYLESQREFSLAQIWLATGTPGKDSNTIEVGWQVHPRLYGDYRTRIFIYWTANAYKSTGCYNLICPGFVQTNKKYIMGGTISTISSYMGKQFTMPLKISKDNTTGDWWLQYGSGSENVIGYWPAKLFTNLKYVAERVKFGGEIVNKKSTGSHTSTAMGSGNFADEGFGKAAYIRNMQVQDIDNKLSPLKNPRFSMTNSNCYNIVQGNTSPKWGDHIYFGGHGRGQKCL